MAQLMWCCREEELRLKHSGLFAQIISSSCRDIQES
jgi:hypothetical protein